MRRREWWDDARRWFEDNFERLKELADMEPLRRHIFEPFNDLIDSFGNTTEGEVKATITQVAIANAVLAGLPGKLGVGVVVAIGLELWMGYRIAAHVGICLKNPGDIFRYFTVVMGVIATVLFAFAHILRGIFSVISALPAFVPATAVSELLASTLVGVLFWQAFEAVGSDRTFNKRLLVRLIPDVVEKGGDLFMYQLRMLTQMPGTLKRAGKELRKFLIEDSPLPDPARRRGEAFATAAVSRLVMGRPGAAFDGPLGKIFLQSIRDRWGEVGPDASATDIAEFMQSQDYTQEQLEGVVSLIKGKMFEHWFVLHENADGDAWIGQLHDDESFPGSDITLTDVASGQEIEISLKASTDPEYIESALLRYPDFPVVTTSELGDYFADDPRVSSSEVSSEEMERITRSNLDALANESVARFDALEGLAVGTVGVHVIRLWPDVVSFLRRKITMSELKCRLGKKLGDAGVTLAKRLMLGAAVGPLYVWYLLARGVMELTPTVRDDQPTVLRLKYVGE